MALAPLSQRHERKQEKEQQLNLRFNDPGPSRSKTRGRKRGTIAIMQADPTRNQTVRMLHSAKVIDREPVPMSVTNVEAMMILPIDESVSPLSTSTA